MSFLGSNPRQSTIDGAVMTNVVYVKYWNKHLPTFEICGIRQIGKAACLRNKCLTVQICYPVLLKAIAKMLNLKKLKIFVIIYIES